jgi:hypothetical protein
MRVKLFVTVLLSVLAAALAGIAQAALPSASTGGTRDVTQTSATLRGTVNPNGEATTFYFQYGTTKSYGSATPVQGPTAANKSNVAASATITQLTPATTYHYRLVAVNASGRKFGGDKTFKTQKLPASITLGVSAGRIVWGRSVTLAGQFTPSPYGSAAGVKVTLQQDPAPFNPSDFKTVTTTKTDSAGRFSFTQSPAVNTTYRVFAATTPRATSGSAAVLVAKRVTISLSTGHPKRGKRVVFSGTVGPVQNGRLVRVQKRVGTRWRTVKSAVLGPSPNPLVSGYKLGLRIRRNGVYRAFVAGDGANLQGVSRRRTIRVR